MTDTQVYPVQLVQPDGRRVHGARYADVVADVDPHTLRGLYEDMVVVRRIDAEATALQRQGQLGIWAPCVGQEAAQVGSARALHADDFVFTSYREHGVAYCRGVDPAQWPRLWRGVALSCWDPDELALTNPAIVVGAQGLHATGYALGAHLDGAEIATVAYFGDGATSQGDLAEALGFASSWGAGVVFFCQNNHWAISEPVQLQSPTPLARKASGYGIASLQVDGNDVLAVLAVTRIAARRAREGGGPSFVEALTYRMGPHTTSDDPTRYRTGADLQPWQARDPIDRLRRLLEREDAWDDRFPAAVQEKAEDAAAAFRAGTLALPDPPPLTVFEHVYSGSHPLIDEERQRYADYLRSFEEARS
ncbi:pyruvate dehydrogenase (acetyl-transferring) E1 component subunit alpha [Rhodococcus sp. NPDC003318]|uniref:pyruvate dehydrogenase (acetyl-transferring) E1 component subunit alpha n=1 Tax=Rhodococcus sp. NPDC003318 TaxID=3364503 RepID=UPI0036969058